MIFPLQNPDQEVHDRSQLQTHGWEAWALGQWWEGLHSALAAGPYTYTHTQHTHTRTQYTRARMHTLQLLVQLFPYNVVEGVFTSVL